MSSPVDTCNDGIVFVIKPEPSRSHADQVRSAAQVVEGMTALIAALDVGAKPMRARQNRNADPTWALPLPGSGAAWMKDRRDGRIRLQISLDGNWTLCTCTVSGRWRAPDAARYRRAAELFLAAARQVSDPAPGVAAETKLRSLAIANMMEGSGESVISAALPWSQPIMVTTGRTANGWFKGDEEIPTDFVASVACADTVDGALLEIDTMSVTIKADEVSVLDRMRAVSEIASKEITP